ncbi:MAG: hypothetical protein ACT4QC_24235 [Planctomycetaceae bacterium]
MRELIQQASDDQLALAICVASVVGTGLIMYFSHYVGRLSGRVRGVQPGGATSASSTRSLPQVSPAAQVGRRDKAA